MRTVLLILAALLALPLTGCSNEEEPVANRFERQKAEIENRARELEAQVENEVSAAEARLDKEAGMLANSLRMNESGEAEGADANAE